MSQVQTFPKPAQGKGPKAPKGAAATPNAAPAARGERRKRETRRKLLRAAYHLMAERGAAAVSINEITEAADVGFGSFYNHFASKEAIHEAIIEEVLTGFSEALSGIDEQLEDPAEILAASIRYVVQRARQQPLWGRFLVRTAFSVHNLTNGMGRFLRRDLQRGLDSGRFRSEDPLMTLLTVGGTAAATISAELDLGSGSVPSGLGAQLGADQGDMAERAASSVLQTLGLVRTEADEIARRPLPRMEFYSENL